MENKMSMQGTMPKTDVSVAYILREIARLDEKISLLKKRLRDPMLTDDNYNSITEYITKLNRRKIDLYEFACAPIKNF